jgi:hypothetical protein
VAPYIHPHYQQALEAQEQPHEVRPINEFLSAAVRKVGFWPGAAGCANTPMIDLVA